MPGSSAGSEPGGIDVAGERAAQGLGVLSIQVDLAAGAVQTGPDRTVSPGRAAVQVAGEQGAWNIAPLAIM